MTARTQPVPAPATVDAYESLLAGGVLVNLGGEPLVRATCQQCRTHTTLGETCPRSLPCRNHHTAAGSPCVRPSGHQVPGGFCRDRQKAAERLDDERQLAGDPSLPAPWPGPIVEPALFA